ncbi:MAG: sensor histidine kinase [Sandaracinaceae bacterium]|nr:sensor histidine kinase [Sandaracinaceae bacterium]
MRSCQGVGILLVGAALLWWPLDYWLFAGNEPAIRAFFILRIATITFTGSLVVGLTFVPWVRARPVGIVLPVMVCLGGVVAYALGQIGGPETPWPHFLYAAMFLSIPVPMSLIARTGNNATTVVLMAIGYFAPHPEWLSEVYSAVWASFMIACLAAGTYFGHLSYRMTLANLMQARALRLLNGQLEHRVEEQTAELHELAAHLEHARETERAHIAHELHDELGQELTALRYTLDLTLDRFQKGSSSIAPNLRSLDVLLARTTQTTRTLVSELRPHLLLELGLREALEWLAQRASTERLQVFFAAPSTLPPLEETQTLAVFRVVQEALTNVARHAQAKEAHVEVTCTPGLLLVRVRDDGVGFDTTRTNKGRLGLVGMRERARGQGGSLQIESAPSAGTTVHLKLPVSATQDDRTG